MTRLLTTIGCCLLLAAPAAGCAQRAASSGVAAEQTGAVTMNETDRQVADVAAQANGWSETDVVVKPLPDATTAGCRLVGVYSSRALPTIMRTYAEVDGEVISPGDPDALARVLDACGEEASAILWAEAIAAFGPDVPPGYVVREQHQISSIAHKWAMRDGGYEFHPPRFTTDGPEGRTVEFLMTDIEGNALYQARGTRAADGTVEVAVKPAGGG